MAMDHWSVRSAALLAAVGSIPAAAFAAGPTATLRLAAKSIPAKAAPAVHADPAVAPGVKIRPVGSMSS